MGRQIGARIIEVCDIVERLGACRSKAVSDMSGTELSNVMKYMARAVGHGLLTVNRDVFPAHYKIVHGWREKLKPVSTPKPRVARSTRLTPAAHHLHAAWASCVQNGA